MISNERKIYLKKERKENILVNIFRILIFILFIFIWELLSRLNIIDTFLLSSPSKILHTIINLYNNYNLLNHIYTTLSEILISFIIGNIIGFMLASILWFNSFINKIIDPYLNILNSLPKVALGPLIIIIFGANKSSIIIMSLLISCIISILTIRTSFNNTDNNMIKIIKSLGGNKLDIFLKVVVPSNINYILDSFKNNISMCFIGVIMGEFLVSKEGIGYLINYGSQIFNMNIVLSSISILIILTIILYILVDKIIVYIKSKYNK